MVVGKEVLFKKNKIIIQRDSQKPLNKDTTEMRPKGVFKIFRKRFAKFQNISVANCEKDEGGVSISKVTNIRKFIIFIHYVRDGHRQIGPLYKNSWQ